MQIGLFLGSFNPVHNGHIQLSEYVLRVNIVDLVLWIVSPQSPNKSAAGLLPVASRLSMSRVALLGNKNIVVSDIETRLPTPSLSIRTICEIKKKHPKDKLFLLLGYDNYITLNTWTSYKKILSLCLPLVYPRSVSNASSFKEYPWHTSCVLLKDAPEIDISATSLRSLIASRKPFGHLVPKEVENIILKKRLFKDPSNVN